MEHGTGQVAKILIFAGLLLAAAGFLLWLLPKWGGFKSLPWDIVIKRENFTFYFPLGTSILVSVLLTLLLYLWRKASG